jgi:nitrate/nitrite transporter NarK
VRPKWWQLITAEVVVILLLYMVNKIGQELVISSIPVITREGFGWTQEGGGYYMAAVGASVLPMILLVNSFVKDLEERELVLRLSNACVLCLLVMLHASFLGSYTLFQYIAGSAVLFAFLNALEGVIMALLAKVISPELARGTFNSGLLATEAGTFGRVLGDFCITLFGVSHNAGDIVNGLFLPLVVMILASSVLVWVYYDRFV